MCLGVVEHEGELRAVAPLLIRTERRWGRPCRVLRFWSNPYSNRVNFVLVGEDPHGAAAALMDGLAGLQDRWDVADWGPMVLHDPTTRVIRAELDRRGARTGIMVGYSSPFRTLPDNWEDVESSLSSSFRGSSRRKVARAEEAGARVVYSDQASDMRVVLDISWDTWQHENGTGIGSTPTIRSFYEGVADWAQDRGSLQLAFLYVDDEPVAFELNLLDQGILYNLKVGYRQSHGGLSPGIVLRYHVLKRAVETGVREFDFLGEAEHYKMHWASGVREHGQLMWFSRRWPWPLVHFGVYRVRPFIKRRLPWVVPALKRLRRLFR